VNGEVELVTCKMVTLVVKKKGKKVKETEQKCTGKLVSGTVKFTTSGKVVKATLSRTGRVYATGTARMGKRTTEGALKLERTLTAGRYTLTLSRGGTVLSRRSVVER
jgi:hypothetical protein